MKTVLVVGLKNVVGGIENYLLLMQKYTSNSLRFVFLIEKEAEDEIIIHADLIKENNGEIVYLPEHHLLKEYRLTFTKILKEYKEVSDEVYVNVDHISFDIIPVVFAVREGYKVIIHAHSAMQERISNPVYRLRQVILHRSAKQILKHLNVARLAVSARAGEYLYDGKRYLIVSPGIEIRRFCYNESIREMVREQFNLGRSLVLGFVGRLAVVKNPLFLIDVLKYTKKTYRDAKLLIVGDGPLKKDVLIKAEQLSLTEDIVFAGEVSNVQDYYQAMDVLLAPSLSEGMPLGIMEAQSAGVPCICAKGNFPETIDVTGIVHFCSLGDGAEAWSNKAQEVYSLDVNRIDMNEKVKNSGLNIENAAKKLLEVLN